MRTLRCGTSLLHLGEIAPTLMTGGVNDRLDMISFIRRLMIHYNIYRRYPLPRVPALRNAWRIARA